MLLNVSPLTVVHDLTDPVYHFRGWFLVQLSMDVREGVPSSWRGRVRHVTARSLHRMRFLFRIPSSLTPFDRGTHIFALGVPSVPRRPLRLTRLKYHTDTSRRR